MDSFAFRAGNAIVGNDFSDAVLEWALAGGAMRVGRDCAFCHTGAGALVRVGTRTIAPYTNTVARAGVFRRVCVDHHHQVIGGFLCQGDG